ncbi:hypothetical protein PPYR_05507 [Photinus pyralis]|uniref:VWFA domain-containing protein n=1 Tax=Photinus pyralis TaxID=7054 RepID=A0A1Y1M4L5_PHOPY|nr:VWFA and cache domain-containing protein 1 [Photinus pyralis]KAB0801153.1 hypothetical protein PPYR_05507 [Photinus pyralis]
MKRSTSKHLYKCLVFTFSLSCLTVCYAKSANVSSRTKVQVETPSEYSLKNVTLYLSKEFNKISDEELGLTVIKELYSKLKYTKAMQDLDKVIAKIANNLESKLNESISLLVKAKEKIENLAKFHPFIQSAGTLCDDGLYGQFEVVTVNSNNSYSELPLSTNQVLRKQLDSVKRLKGAIKQMYLLSRWDVISNAQNSVYNCNIRDESLLWKLYVLKNADSTPRNVMLLLDHGGSLSKHQFHIVKAVAKHMISVLNGNDKVGVLGISDEWSYPYITDQCLMPNQIPPASDSHVLSPATDHNKYLLNRFIDSLTKGNGVTNHSLGFQQAFQTIKSSNISANESVMLLYISRGLLSSLTEAKTVLETISSMVDELDNKILINTCAVIDESKPVMYETHFLRDIAEQNYTKYNIDVLSNVEKGIMLLVNSSQAIGLAVAQFYNIISSGVYSEKEPSISLPIWDQISNDLTVSITMPCDLNGENSVLGADVYFSNIAEDVTYYSNYHSYSYAFLIDMQGTAIMHPSYPRPASIKNQPKFVDIFHLEKITNFTITKQKLLTEVDGSYTLKAEAEVLRFIWKRVLNWYVVVIVVNETEATPIRPYKVSWFPSTVTSKLVHHRLDIIPGTNLCKHLNQIATLDAGSLYLSSSCFQSPFSYLHFSTGETTSLLIQTYMAYLKDNTRLLANPGFKEEVRDDVVALAHIMEFLRLQHLTGSRAKYIVRRYIVTPTGVVQMFPGSFIPSGIEPTKRVWYLRAVDHRYKTILTPPYLDAGGAGYIVTIAFATQHVVTAMDVTFGYIYKLLLQNMPFCKDGVKCFLMDDRGYLIYHPNLIDPNGHGPIEQQHIIHKESLVANDILNHKHFVKKMLCNDYAHGTIQRFYRLNTSLNEILTNAVHGEHCVKYQVSVIEGTNTFVGMVNATCEVIATFCPCSMVDRLCLNCNRMEQKECECPCECPLEIDTCTHPNKTFMENPLCGTTPELSLFVNSMSHTKYPNNELKSCLPVSCELQLTYESCLGVLGCEWCQLDVDGETLLTNPFCTSFTTCFNGVLGSVTPYGDAISGSSTSDDLLGSTYSPIGPIVGSIVGVSLIIGLIFFCYRSYSTPSIDRCYFASTQGNQVRMSDFNMSDEFQEIDNHQDKLLQDTKKREPISPYCVSTGYRRPLTAADSDHGYSTMTPHDESEHLSFAPIEIDSLEDDCISDATSINTSVSSKQPKANSFDLRNKMRVLPHLTDLQMTSVPNRIIAPVTVHRNMEVT